MAWINWAGYIFVDIKQIVTSNNATNKVQKFARKNCTFYSTSPPTCFALLGLLQGSHSKYFCSSSRLLKRKVQPLTSQEGPEG